MFQAPTAILKLKKSTLKDQISLRIKEMIISNTLQPGQVIVIDKLANDFGVSHTPIREALAMLERDGFVELNSYQNPRVVNVTEKDVREVYEMRLMVEGWACESAAKNLKNEQIEELLEQLEVARIEVSKHNFIPHLETDLMLHELIMRSTDNSLFWNIAEHVHEKSVRVRALVEAKGTTRDVEKIVEEHFEIMFAIKNRDAAKAKAAMLNHLQHGLLRTLNALK